MNSLCLYCKYFDRQVWQKYKDRNTTIAGARACLSNGIATDGSDGVKKIACMHFEPFDGFEKETLIAPINEDTVISLSYLKEVKQ